MAESTANGNGNGIETNERGELVLDITALRPKPRWLKLRDSNGGPMEVKIPGGLSLETMLDLQAMEQKIRGPQTGDAEVIDTIRSFADLLTGIISRENPDLDEDVRLDLGIQEATYLLVFLAQPDDSMAAAFINALTAGGGEKPDAAIEHARRLAKAAGMTGEEAEPERPLRSAKRSSKPSSRSANSTAGRRSGGSAPAARGPRSAPTSHTRSKGSGNARAT